MTGEGIETTATVHPAATVHTTESMSPRSSLMRPPEMRTSVPEDPEGTKGGAIETEEGTVKAEASPPTGNTVATIETKAEGE